MADLNRYKRLFNASRCIVSFPISEYMKVRYIQRGQKIYSFRKILICFSRKPGDYIYTNTTVANQIFYKMNLFSIEFSPVSSSHQSKNFIATTLKRNMEMRHKFRARGNKIDNLFC